MFPRKARKRQNRTKPHTDTVSETDMDMSSWQWPQIISIDTSLQEPGRDRLQQIRGPVFTWYRFPAADFCTSKACLLASMWCSCSARSCSRACLNAATSCSKRDSPAHQIPILASMFQTSKLGINVFRRPTAAHKSSGKDEQTGTYDWACWDQRLLRSSCLQEKQNQGVTAGLI